MPKELRLQAARAAVLLLPDENREVLKTLLCLLSDVTASVSENQMTPTNLAVCLAPSLFHLNTLRRKESSSPRCVSVPLLSSAHLNGMDCIYIALFQSLRALKALLHKQVSIHTPLAMPSCPRIYRHVDRG